MSHARGHVPRLLVALPAAALALVALLLPMLSGLALAGEIEAGATNVRSDDPTSITFSTRVQASAGLESATFVYKVLNPDGNVGGSGAATFSPGTEADLSFTLEANNANRYIPVGSDFAFHWELTDTEGDRVSTEEETYTFLDGRYQWQTRSADGVTAYWYGDDDRQATLALESTRASVDEAEALLQTEVPYQVKVLVWRSEEEGQLAMRPRATTFDAQVVTGGQRVAPDLLFVFTPNADVIRHEAAHIVTHVAGDGPFTQIPAWLDEGTAVYMQNDPGAGYRAAVEFAIQTDSAFSLRSIQSPANSADRVNQFYGQSWHTVNFMVEEFSPEAFAEVYRLIYAGSPTDEALTEVYGVDQDGLYNLWREANGLEPVDFGPRGSTETDPGAQATRPPLGIPTTFPGGSTDQPAAPNGSGGEPAPPDDAGGSASSESSSNVGVALAVGLGTLLLAGVLGGGGLLLLRRR
ncbi:MAG: hypothetical protein GEU80_10750 [Dehalococcoidia bacterium]|nr:hypothetical protein [Dehalococcoidia bacterium]